MSTTNSTPEISLADMPTYRAGVAQSTTYRLLKKFTEGIIAKHNLTMMQWFIIGTIYDAGPLGIGVTELSKAVDTNVPYITNTLNLLERNGMIERTTREGDNRSKVVTIASHYEPFVEKIEADVREAMRASIYKQVTPEELRVYINVLFKLSNTLA
jgi:DNA-binding MarR family transcriptional regulator